MRRQCHCAGVLSRCPAVLLCGHVGRGISRNDGGVQSGKATRAGSVWRYWQHGNGKLPTSVCAQAARRFEERPNSQSD